MHSVGELPVNIGICVFQPSYLHLVHVLRLLVNGNNIMLSDMLASLAVFPGGETIPLFVQIGLFPPGC